MRKFSVEVIENDEGRISVQQHVPENENQRFNKAEVVGILSYVVQTMAAKIMGT